MRIKDLAESIRELDCVRQQTPEAEIFSVAQLNRGERPRPGVAYVCSGGDFALPAEEMTALIVSGDIPENVPSGNVFRSALPAEELLGRIMEALANQARLDSACARLISVSAAGKGIQSVLDCAYAIIGNPMILVDSSYKLIACNQDIADFREDIAEQQKRGFMLSQNIEEMKKERIYEVIRQSRYPYYSVQSRDGLDVGWMNALVYTDGMEVAQLGIPEINRQFEPSDYEIVHFLCQLIGLELQKNDFYRKNMGYMHSVLLCDLLDGLIQDEHTAQLRAAQLNWELGERMCLITMFDMAYGMFDRKARIISEKMHGLIPKARWASYDNKVVFLLPWKQLPEDNEIEEGLSQFLANNALVCACSAEFSGLLDVRAAYEQTLRAYELGSRLAPQDKLYRYDRFVCQHIGQILKDKGNLRSFCHPGVLRLAEADRDNDAKLISTLHAYLRHPDNPGAAAKELYIHKNTLFYRMHKIREDHGLNLADGAERVWIQLTLEFLRL